MFENAKINGRMATRTLACCAMLAAISVVLARLLSFAPIPEVRISLDKFPLFLAGLFFGPLAGSLVGFVADFVGCLLSPYGFNPVFCPPAILYGLCGGLFSMMLRNKLSLPRLGIAYLCPVAIGSLLYQSAALAWVYSAGTFWEAFYGHLGSRGIQFAIISVLEIAITYLLLKSRIFERLHIWPNRKK